MNTLALSIKNAAKKTGSVVCVGLDPVVEKLPKTAPTMLISSLVWSLGDTLKLPAGPLAGVAVVHEPTRATPQQMYTGYCGDPPYYEIQ